MTEAGVEGAKFTGIYLETEQKDQGEQSCKGGFAEYQRRWAASTIC